MLQLARAIVGIVSDVLRLCVLFMRVSGAVRAENLVLRRQLARYIERGIKPKRVDHVTRVSLAPAIDPQAVGGPLPSRASAYVARSWGSRSPGTLDGGPQSRGPTSHRRTPCGARPIGAGRTAPRILACSRIGLIEYLRSAVIFCGLLATELSG